MLSGKGDLGVDEFSMAILCCPGVDPNLVPEGWVRNNYRRIVWGLDSLERRLGRLVLTPTALMGQAEVQV